MTTLVHIAYNHRSTPSICVSDAASHRTARDSSVVYIETMTDSSGEVARATALLEKVAAAYA